MDLTKLSGRKLELEISKRSTAHKAMLDRVIAAGMGQMRGTEIRDLAKGSSLLSKTLLAREWVAVSDAYQEANDELYARQRYHGGNKPIKRT